MSGRAEGGDQRSRRARVRPILPVIPVEGREDMAVMLARHGRLLREYALHFLGDGATVDDVEEVVERTVDVLLAAETVAHPHGLRHATQQLWRECQRAQQRQEMPAVPVDRRLGPLTEPVRRVLDRLGPRSRETIIRAAEGWTPEQQASAENTSVGTINIRLHRARRRALQLLEKGGPTLSGVLFTLPGRLRIRARRLTSWCQRRGTVMSWSGSGDPFTQLTAATILAMVGVASVAPAATPVVAGRAVVSAPAHAAVQPAAAQLPLAASVPRSAGDVQPHQATVEQPRTGAAGPPNLVNRMVSGSETPGDTRFTAAVAAPDYDTTHTIVALGVGNTCQCVVLFQSVDGGASWTPSPATVPPGAEELALPPAYPADPRVFIGTDPQSGQSAYVMPSFDGAPMPLAGPAGYVALAAGFDHGDDRAFIAGHAVVVSVAVDATPQTVTPVLAYPQWLTSAAVLATPPVADGAAVLVFAPPFTMVVSDPLSGQTQAAAIFACGTGTTCTRRGTPPAQANDFTVSQSGTVSAASWATGVGTSLDGGQSFATRALPSGWLDQSTAATASRIWAVLKHNATAAVMWLPSGGGTWTDVTSAGNGLAQAVKVVAIPRGPVLALLLTGGLQCSADGGTTWAGSCP